MAVRAGAAAAAGLIRAHSGVRWVGIYTVADGEVVNEAWDGPGPPAHPTFAADQGLTSHAIRTAASVVSNDVANDPRYLTNQTDSGSELIVPIVVDGAVVGTLDIESDVVGAFDAQRVTWFEQLAGPLGALWRD
jgi:GAF domain-containing protein